jgi:hypothetical protein
MTNETIPNNVEVGDIMSITHYVKVNSTSINGGDTDNIVVESLDDGMGEFQVNGPPLIRKMKTADRYNSQEAVTQTALAELLLDSKNAPFTVVFEKKDGSLRTLRGRFLASEPLMGRSKVEDLDIKGDQRIRLVDHRTLKSIIVNGVKYALSDG